LTTQVRVALVVGVLHLGEGREGGRAGGREGAFGARGGVRIKERKRYIEGKDGANEVRGREGGREGGREIELIMRVEIEA